MKRRSRESSVTQLEAARSGRSRGLLEHGARASQRGSANSVLPSWWKRISREQPCRAATVGDESTHDTAALGAPRTDSSARPESIPVSRALLPARLRRGSRRLRIQRAMRWRACAKSGSEEPRHFAPAEFAHGNKAAQKPCALHKQPEGC